jgi:succinyl-CoA synthetase beta subunit
MPDSAAFELLRKAKIPIADFKLAKKPAEAIAACASFGYPCVLKIDAPVIHKAKAGCVKVAENEAQVRPYFDTIMKAAKKQLKITSAGGASKSPSNRKISGMIVQPFVKGKELIVGGKRDPQFGTLLLFGSGGTLAEVLKDVAFRVLPIDAEEAEMLIGETKAHIAYPELQNNKVLKQATSLLLAVAHLLEANPKIKELDINPVMLTEGGPVAVDVRIIA